MKAYKKFFSNISVLTLILSVSISSPAQEEKSLKSQRVAAGLTQLNSFYQTSLSQGGFDPDDGSDIIQICIMNLFRNVADVYLDLLDTSTGVTPNDVGDSLMKFGREYVDISRNYKVFNYFREGIVGAVRSELKTAVQAGFISESNSSNVTLDDPSLQIFLKNVSYCGNPDFLQRVVEATKPGDFSKPIPPEILNSNKNPISWITSPRGGIRPDFYIGPVILNPAPVAGVVGIVGGAIVNSPAPSVRENPIFKPVPANVSYLDFVKNISRAATF